MMINKIKDYKYAYAIDMKQNRPTTTIGKMFGLMRFIYTNKVIFGRNDINPTLSSAYQFEQITQEMSLSYHDDYVYPWDLNVIRHVPKGDYRIASTTVDYSWMLHHPLKDKLEEIKILPEGNFKKALIITLDAIKELAARIAKELKVASSARNSQLSEYISNIWDKPCKSFDECIQRILFFQALFWQNKHRQNGIGRVDYWLESFYINDVKKGVLNREQAKQHLFDMVRILGKDLKAKSNSYFAGDTGQVIIIGGVDEKGNTVENDITHILLEIFKEKPVPDPKLILRINSSTSDAVWQDAVRSILKGSGSPLIMNEELVIPLMEKFGYEKQDVYNVGTSACWEPLIIGKSLDQNNCIPNIPVVTCIETVLKQYSNETYGEFLSNAEKEIAKNISDWNLNIKFESSSLLSLFFDDCIAKGKDFTAGGAKYNYHGILIVSFPNLINSILNIKKFVYEEKVLNLHECEECIEHDYEGREDIRQLFLTNPLKFGLADEEVLGLTQHLMDVIEEATSKRTMFGQKIKVGFSSPSYIGLSKNCQASLDGRKKGEPFAVHISPVSSHIDISEIFDFASKLQYKGCNMNGNVVDFMVPAAYAKNEDKFVTLLKESFKKGLFEVQLNVVDKQTLIDAKAHPEKYPNLVVRVWGFSAYFNDLPEEYKDNLIARAETYGQ